MALLPCASIQVGGDLTPNKYRENVHKTRILCSMSAQTVFIQIRFWRSWFYLSNVQKSEESPVCYVHGTSLRRICMKHSKEGINVDNLL